VFDDTFSTLMNGCSGQFSSLHFLENCFDMRDPGAALDREQPPPHPVSSRRVASGPMTALERITDSTQTSHGIQKPAHTRTWGQAHRGKLALPHRAD